MKRALVTFVATLAVLAASGAASASWQGPGSGAGWARAESMPAGNKPTTTVSGRNVTVSWTASTFPGGLPVNGYLVKRYDGSGNVQTVGAGCAGMIGALTCTEAAVPSGSWRYTATPQHGAWTGTESTTSAAVSVGSPTLTLSPSNPKVLSLPSTLSGSIASFVDGETLRFRLDSTGGSVLAGTVGGTPTPAAVPSGGSAPISVTIPAGVADGSHTVYAVTVPSGESASAGFSLNVSPPALTALEMFDSNLNGRVDRVVATFSDDIVCNAPCTSPWTLSNVPSGGTLSSVSVATNRATLSLTEGAGAQDTAVGLFGVALSASPTGVRDADGHQSSFSATAPTDKAGPVPTAISDTNVGTDGKMEAGDTLSVTFSEALAAASVPATASVTETDPNGTGNDTLAISGVTAGALDTGSDGYIKNNNSYASFSGSTVVLTGASKTVAVTVGGSCYSSSGTCAVNILAGGSGSLSLVPAGSLTDSVGNPAVGSVSRTFKLF